jgi:hypothetical protein
MRPVGIYFLHITLQPSSLEQRNAGFGRCAANIFESMFNIGSKLSALDSLAPRLAPQ